MIQNDSVVFHHHYSFRFNQVCPDAG